MFVSFTHRPFYHISAYWMEIISVYIVISEKIYWFSMVLNLFLVFFFFSLEMGVCSIVLSTKFRRWWMDLNWLTFNQISQLDLALKLFVVIPQVKWFVSL